MAPAGRILKVILYGSYARGDWVDDPIGGYQSDYDILVVVSDERLTEPGEFWAKADDQFVREVTISKRISAPVSFIVHSLADVNNQLTQGGRSSSTRSSQASRYMRWRTFRSSRRNR